ncbi:unnamed protein product [Heligmosomoides polygyrus]|uniref:Uncharacterized protein n=1 Tax=Heligmosomoides polygyrus TaxID=6339 RepID=A0A183FP63_HELPZ|nr:unnamed protein product [Heligmosomoides polygyrus]
MMTSFDGTSAVFLSSRLQNPWLDGREVEELLSGDNDLHQSIIKALDAYNRVTKSFGDDYSDTTDRDRSLVTDAKIVPYETVAPQHRPLICTLKIAPPRLKQMEQCGAARTKGWRMKEKEAAVISRVRLPTVTSVDETWKKATDTIRQAA